MNQPETQSLRERWDAEAENWVYVLRTKLAAADSGDFNFPRFLQLLLPTLEVGCGESRIVRALAPEGLLIPRCPTTRQKHHSRLTTHGLPS
jgi:hypothetical protein